MIHSRDGHGRFDAEHRFRTSARAHRETATAPATVFDVGRLIVIEGLDGAGKRTLVGGLGAELRRRGHSVAHAAFPRYGVDVHADLVAEALRGSHGDLASSVHGIALLHALDRRSAAESLRVELGAHDFLLLDRYVASNAAYGAARLHQGAGGDFVAWDYELEVRRFALPRPDVQVLLRVPAELAASRAEHRERTESDRDRDSFESDSGLQRRCAEVYTQLAREQWWSPWRIVDGVDHVDYAELADSVH